MSTIYSMALVWFPTAKVWGRHVGENDAVQRRRQRGRGAREGAAATGTGLPRQCDGVDGWPADAINGAGRVADGRDMYIEVVFTASVVPAVCCMHWVGTDWVVWVVRVRSMDAAAAPGGGEELSPQ